MGIETGDEEVMRKMGKGTDLKLIKAAHEAAQKAGVSIGTFFLFGQLNETPESLKRTIDLAVQINPELPMFGLMTPYPGTEVASLAAQGKAGYRLLTTDWDVYNKQIGGAMAFANLSRQQIEWYQLQAYAKVFLLNGRFADFAKFLWEYKKGAWSVLKKSLLGKSMSDMLNKPPDYDEVLSGGNPIALTDMVEARRQWQITQKTEMKNARDKQTRKGKDIFAL